MDAFFLMAQQLSRELEDLQAEVARLKAALLARARVDEVVPAPARRRRVAAPAVPAAPAPTLKRRLGRR